MIWRMNARTKIYHVVKELRLHCYIEDKNGGQGKGYPNPNQTFQAKFNELLFISIALKVNQTFVDSLMISCEARMPLHR